MSEMEQLREKIE
jgi:hypothetical protein